MLYLRAFVRAGGHGLLPGLCRPDLLAVLFARRALPRSLQAACADWRAGVGDAGQDAAGADLRPDQFPARALSRRVRGIRRPGRADARADLPADVGDDCGRQSPSVRRAVEGVLCADHHHRRGGVAVRAGATEPPRGGSGNAAADHAADPGNRRAQAHRRRTAARQGSRGIRQPRQEPLRGGPEPRTALAAERHLGLCAIAGAGFQPCHQAARPGARGPPQRRSSVGTDRRHSGHFQDRGRPALSVARRGAVERISRSARRHVSRPGRRQGYRLRFQAAFGAARRRLCRRKAPAPGSDQPAVECAEVHANRQRAVRRALPQPGRRVRDDRHRPRHPGQRSRTHLCAVRTRRARRLAAADRHRSRPHHQPAARRRDGRRHQGDERGRQRQHLPRQDPAVGSHQSDADRAGGSADLRLSRPAQDDPDHRRRSDPARPPARGADAARLHPAQRARRSRLSRAGAALPARSVSARYLDGRHGRMDGGGNAARERPSSGPHPDGVGERAGGARRAAGAAVP